MGTAHATGPEGVFIVHPYDLPTRVFTRFRPLTLYLAGVLGSPLRLAIASTYDEQIAMISDGRAQLAYLGPTPYVRARERGRVKMLAGVAINGQACYLGAIVVRADSPVQRVSDLKGRCMAFGAKSIAASILASGSPSCRSSPGDAARQTSRSRWRDDSSWRS